MYSALAHAHSGLRWVVLILLVFAIVNSISRKSVYEKKDKMIYLFAMVFLHIQLLIGLGLYFMSDKVVFADGWIKEPLYRFYGLEHFVGMLIAIVIVTIGRRKGEKASDPAKKHRIIRNFYLIGLVIILASIPWPFREALLGGWF